VQNTKLYVQRKNSHFPSKEAFNKMFEILSEKQQVNPQQKRNN